MVTTLMDKLIYFLVLSQVIDAYDVPLTTQSNKGEEILDNTSLSFGIRSFTVEVTTPTEKPLHTLKNNSKTNQLKPLRKEVISTLSDLNDFRQNISEIVPTKSVSESATRNRGSNSEPTSTLDTIQDIDLNNLHHSSIQILEHTTTPADSEGVFFNDSTKKPVINETRLGRKLENGLYRIKLAEIITDEFGNSKAPEGGQLNRIDNVVPRFKVTEGKINIIDLYPSKLEDFGPIIKDSNEKIIKEKQKLLSEDKNVMPNSINQLFEEDSSIPTSKIEIELIEENDNSHWGTDDQGKITDLTGKLQEQDGVITEIEKKFRLDDLKHTTPKTISVNHRIDFIDRRVKKSYNNPATKQSEFERIDFANTKFRTDTPGSLKNDKESLHSQSDKPEFSTTKFYNSKELYNEMLHKKTKVNDRWGLRDKTTKQTDIQNTKELSKNFKSEKVADSTVEYLMKLMEDVHTLPPASATNPTQPNRIKSTLQAPLKVPLGSPDQITTMTKSESTLVPHIKATPLATPNQGLAIDLESSTSYPSLKTSAPQIVSTLATITEQTTFPPSLDSHKITPGSITVQSAELSSKSETPVSTATVPTTDAVVTSNINSLQSRASSTTVTPTTTTTIRTSTTRKSFSRPHMLTRLQEKINSLECDIMNLPQDSHLWRGNETHELLLPITTPDNCGTSVDCMPMIISWEGQAEIQSGDVLLVEINDILLAPSDFNDSRINNTHKAPTTVYQVTRPGHEHCDVTEGVLLDITPLVVDGKKLVTLYDKDLTEGVNLLIVVSQLWGPQCVRLKVTVKADNCGENAECSGKGICFSNASMEGYECQCCGGFAGPHCEEIDACSPSPCTNNGICVDLSQGHEGNAYQCLCPYGYTGKNCQYESDPCNPTECMNGGSCVGNSTHFRCDCAPGYTGPLCQHNLNECESSPCVHGICVDQEDGFRCFCQPGFAGELCNFEYNECESNPCLNGGQCNDQIGGFECKCTRGYTGKRCHVKVDFCANGPCPEGHRCIDRGDDFTCECPGGRNGPDCNQVPRTLCTVNPCKNGGTCWTSEESFYCACRPGYTGKICEDEFVVETVVSSSEFMIDDTNARSGFSDKSFGEAISERQLEFHKAYIAAGTLAVAVFIVAIVVTICHCKVHQTYRRFSTRHHQLIPIFGFARRSKSPKSHRHWLSGKGGGGGNGNLIGAKPNKTHLPGTGGAPCHNHHIGSSSSFHHHQHSHQVHDRPFQRHLAMNLENDMYYTVDFSDSQHSPLIQ